ncbi:MULTISPECIES: Holliday junction resolvase RuvX [Anaerococcus]|jgi:RNAse H domain protein, YqgF family|uniref:Putative pre-16S rRNA nuclease n=1 Tax=Anaerococcus nagyae TaxID=1755241 RepID=A0A3E2TK28_9FIRM|nr:MULTISPECIES: Holliday junction resolvase RuvX [Anaerococcus]MBP2069732.1 putative Holliday junction resolvase [Anaerococcus nagyae]MDU1829373.1 Holliday junction resolvase RuvX [Anaerococcus sp.]MDU1863945.1 Holliday junction resolvase RuvX [Anaerococcus sp.]MDU2354146.1 Holliday junction resolvase RuvX [Anaerococcus sp.]MDU2565585.1 Holliday junction resolvase RuvX [Anaerococcus sp.]
MTRIMGLDVGDKTIGVALSDPMFLMAHPLETIKRKKASLDIAKLVEIIDREDVETIVVGLPKNMNNSIGPQSMKVMSFVDLLKKQTDKEIIYEDERMTTIQSEKVLIDMKVRRENRKEHIDKIAASFILQTYLDRRKNG